MQTDQLSPLLSPVTIICKWIITFLFVFSFFEFAEIMVQGSSQPHKKNLCVRDAVLSGDYLAVLVHVNKGKAKSVVIFDEDDHLCFRLEGRQNKKRNMLKKNPNKQTNKQTNRPEKVLCIARL